MQNLKGNLLGSLQQGTYVEIWQRMVYTAQVVFEVSVCFAYVHVDAGLPSIAYSYFMFDK